MLKHDVHAKITSRGSCIDRSIIGHRLKNSFFNYERF